MTTPGSSVCSQVFYEGEEIIMAICKMKSLFILIVFLMAAGGVYASPEASSYSGGRELRFYYGLQNPALRDHFREKSVLLLGRRGSSGRVHYPHSRAFLAQHVDRMLEHFLEDVHERIQLVNRVFGAARLAQIRVLERDGNDFDLSQVLRSWKQALNQLAEETDRLRKDLSRIFPDLDGNSRFNPRIKGDPARADFQREMAFIGTELDTAVRRIFNQLYRPPREQVVTVEELQEGDMLTSLERVKTMAEELEETLPSTLP